MQGVKVVNREGVSHYAHPHGASPLIFFFSAIYFNLCFLLVLDCHSFSLLTITIIETQGTLHKKAQNQKTKIL